MMKDDTKKPVLVVTLIGLALFSIPPTAFSKEQGGNPFDFAATSQNNFPSLATPQKHTPSLQASTAAPSGQAADPEPVSDSLSWKDYHSELDRLDGQYGQGQIDAQGYVSRVQDLQSRFRKSERKRGRGFYREDITTQRPIDVRALQFEKGLIRVSDRGIEET